MKIIKRKTKKHLWRIWRDGLVWTWLMKKILHALRISRFFIVKRQFYRAYVQHDPFSLWMWMYPRITRPDELFVHRFLQAGDVVLDVGANIGIITLTAASAVGPSGKVISYEPHPHTFSFLKRNISLNLYQNIVPHNMALGNSVGTSQILNHYVKDINHIVETGGVEIEMTTLDVHCTEPHINFLKIDAEGYELFILRGASQTLSRTDVVFVEFSPKTYTRFEYTFTDVWNELVCAGFSVYEIQKDYSLVKIDGTYITHQKYKNVIALRNMDEYYRRMST